MQAGVKLPGSQKAQKCPDCLKLVAEETRREREGNARRLAANAAMGNLLVKRKAEPESPSMATVFDDADCTEIGKNNQCVPILFKQDV